MLDINAVTFSHIEGINANVNAKEMLTEYKMSYEEKDHLQLEGEQVTSLIKLEKSTSVFCFLNSTHKLKSYNASAHFHLEGVQVPSNYRKSHSVFQTTHT